MTIDMIETIADLEGVVGKTPPPMHLKVIHHLDQGALRWIAQSPLMFATFGSSAGIGVTLGGDVPGFVSGTTHELRIPLDAFDDPRLAVAEAAFGSLFLVPGIGETLRVNGRVKAIESGHVHVAIEECYGHCAKALIRSDFWNGGPVEAPEILGDFVAACRFMGLATNGSEGRADLSPKGDPAGCMAQLDGDHLWFADRPGNRRVDSFRNLIEQRNMALILLVPGSTSVAVLRGRATLTTDEAARKRFVVKDKLPLLAIGVEVEGTALQSSAALSRARLWPVHATSDIDPAKLFIEHIKLNKVGGIGAVLARASLSVPGMTGLVKKGLDKDYRDNLY
ncbi:pyridoxamine 5'-phosphate oxidase family protein [Sphingobium cloacae]|uniref:Pyridoxamine 5'-phosphate oxidase N-terminal domain-containing protein n=1 Tax=Sphingobium cloacae TaxID=120107 RepID=A0A1E1EYP7_9SPHN|nr:pyridoxamine 5'-phosphate oxidase family protein [Sphingobium cloacae]BAV63388.1 hypothetical protein SCLO_1003480 [Sphingobium cloacae]